MKCPLCNDDMVKGYRAELFWYPDLIDVQDSWDKIKNSPIRESWWECFDCYIKIPIEENEVSKND